MAKTKSNLDRDQKRDELLRVARRLFLADGFEAMFVNRIAEEVRVAPNTLYWYFTDKDALLLAVLDALVGESLHDFEQRKSSSLEAQLRWLLGLLSGAQRLVTTVHTRATTVERVRAWHDAFHRLVEATVEEQLRSRGLARGHEADAARATMFVVEGLLAHPRPREQQHRLLKWLVSLVQASSAAA